MRIAARDRLPVNARIERVRNVRVALAAGSRHVESVNRRLRIVGRQNLVRAVAVGAHRGLLRSVLHRAPVHALLVGNKRLRALAVRLHQELLPVAPSAGGGNIGVIHRRLGVVAGQHLVRAAVAVLAGRRRASVFPALPSSLACRLCAYACCASAWQPAQVIFCGGFSCARLFTSVWQSTQPNIAPWTECLSLSWSTNRLAGLPLTSVSAWRRSGRQGNLRP